jgi:hypothetical protein
MSKSFLKHSIYRHRDLPSNWLIAIQWEPIAFQAHNLDCLPGERRKIGAAVRQFFERMAGTLRRTGGALLRIGKEIS